ncbi:hypothetical protein PG994_009928 [Apiospora phragmitis]|uniref:Nephrocystin 3-like N-terminal domain-containing protein n=1 Tax=Apiospora phragmitis TaxID=2905665 RepID=A0ABR1TR51_9PEZI
MNNDCTGPLVLSHFRNYAYPSSTKYDIILRSLLLQLVRKGEDLAAYVYEEYDLVKKVPGVPVMERLLHLLLSSISKGPGEAAYVWIVLDGIDECETLTQNRVFKLISQATSRKSSSNEVICKGLVSCRFSAEASAKLREMQPISLAEEKKHISIDIKHYSAQRLRSMQTKLQQMNVNDEDIGEIQDAITEKADGMFLYARLVLDYLSSNVFFSAEEVKTSVHELPAKLSKFRIMTQILVRLDDRSVTRVKCALGWIAFSNRPLKKIEFLSAVAFSSGDANVKQIAPQYMWDMFIQSSSSNLVLIESDCLLQHGIATITCLLAGIEYVPDGLPHEPVLFRIIKGLHGFHIYSKEHWTDYLLSLTLSNQNHGSPPSLLFHLACELATKLNQLLTNPVQLPEKPNGPLFDDQQKPTKFMDERIENLGSPLLQGVVDGCLKARSAEQIELKLEQIESRWQPINDSPTSAIPPPQERVSLILQRYQTAIRYLLGGTDYPGITAAEFDFFKQNFRNSAHTCRVKGCPEATDGFERQAQYHEHEMLHVRRLICTYSGCPYPPFTSFKSLKCHINKNHGTAPPRKSIRKSGQTAAPRKS